jgi:hypothetical protein
VVRVPDSRRRQIASSRTDTFRTEWREPGYRRRDPGYRRGNDGVEQQTQRIYKKVALLAFDLLARIKAMRIDTGPPFLEMPPPLSLVVPYHRPIPCANSLAGLPFCFMMRPTTAHPRAHLFDPFVGSAGLVLEIDSSRTHWPSC